jgi:tetratricopeptide (TPR) repeat protein
LQANELALKHNIESNALVKQLAEEAIALDPQYAWAYYLLGVSYEMDVWLGTTESPKQSLAKATELLKQAIVLDDNLAEAHGLLGFIYAIERRHDEALTQGKKAVALNPNSARAHLLLGKIHTFARRDEESIPEYKKAIRLNPIPPGYYFWSLGLSYGLAGQYDEAIPWCEKAVHMEPDDLLARLMMTAVYSWSGRDEEARAEAAEVLRIDPDFSLERFAKKAGPDLIRALRKAGLK